MNNNLLQDLRDFLIEWNNKYPYDRIYRKKYNIAFNSEQHRNLSPIDIFLDVYEDKIIENHIEKYSKKKKDLEDYKNGGSFLRDIEENMSDEQKDDIFAKIMSGIKNT